MMQTSHEITSAAADDTTYASSQVTSSPVFIFDAQIVTFACEICDFGLFLRFTRVPINLLMLFRDATPHKSYHNYTPLTHHKGRIHIYKGSHGVLMTYHSCHDVYTSCMS